MTKAYFLPTCLTLSLALSGCAQAAPVEDYVVMSAPDTLSACGMAFDPDLEVLEVTEVATARWSTATGCNVRVESGGIPVKAWGFVFIGSGPEAVYSSDPQLQRHQVCGATISRPSEETLGIYLSTEEKRCSLEDAVMHEIGHALAKPGTHATDGIGAPGDSPERTSAITAGSLSWVCQTFACDSFIPE